MRETLPHFDVTPTYEMPAAGRIVVGETVRVAAMDAASAEDYIAAHLVAARLTPVCFQTVPVDAALATPTRAGR